MLILQHTLLNGLSLTFYLAHIYKLYSLFFSGIFIFGLSDWLTAKRFERTAILAFGRVEKLIKITNGNEWKNLAGWKLDFEYFMRLLVAKDMYKIYKQILFKCWHFSNSNLAVMSA